MTTNRMKFFCSALGLSAVLMLSGRAQATLLQYEITVNTSGLSGTPGYLDFEFLPAVGSDPGTATLTGFITDGTLTTPATPAGAVSGSLPGTVVIANTDLIDEYTPGFVFGSFFDVFVTLDIPTVSGTATGGNSFTLDAEDTGFNSELSSSFPALEIDLDTSAKPTVTNNAPGTVGVTQTPEPGTLALFGLGLAGVLFIGRVRGLR